MPNSRASSRASQPPMLSTPSATEESRGYTAAQAIYARGAPAGAARLRPAVHQPDPDGAADHHHDRQQLRLGEAEQHVVVAAHELDEEALGAGEDQVEPEQRARPPAVAPAPQQQRDEAHRDRLVDRRRVDLLGGRHRPVRIRHRPRPVPGDAVVAVAGELAADAADRVADRERDGRDVEHLQRQELAPPGPQEHADGAAERAAVPDEAGAGEEAAEDVVLGVGPVLGDPPQPRADDPADERGEDHLVGPVDGLADLLQELRGGERRRPRSRGPSSGRRSAGSAGRARSRAACARMRS